MHLTRRSALRFGAAAIGSFSIASSKGQSFAAEPAENAPTAAGEIETYGLSTFGDLALPPDFKHLSYVNPDAPKGGTLSIQIKNTSGNQNFDTFDTLNIYVFKGNGAAGMDATFDTLMGGTGDEADSVYGLVAESVKIAADKLTYRFRLRPEARFHDGSPVTAADVAFSLNILKTKGHPEFRVVLAELASAEAEDDHVLKVTFTPNRSRDLHLVVAGMPIFSQAWWQGRDFEASTLDAPLGSGPYKVSRFEQGRYIEFERVQDYWGADLPLNIGANNFDRIRYEYYRERQVAFEAFKAGSINFNEEYTARLWATAYDFPAVQDGRVKKVELHNGAPTPTQGWYFNLRRDQFKDPRIREAIGLAFDFEWTNRNIMYSAYKRQTSYFENSPMKAVGKPGPDEL
ncbi:MAG TPA: extracellular solute-binding protein, partial [Beijerinckiaceae bacterium]|nr:extracellular solute-binding protein [Beijerinckiaceae bacterium]